MALAGTLSGRSASSVSSVSSGPGGMGVPSSSTDTFSITVSLSLEPTTLPTALSALPVGAIVSVKKTPPVATILSPPTVDAPVLRWSPGAALSLTTKLTLASDGRSIAPKLAKLTVVEARKAGSGKVRHIGTCAFDLVARAGAGDMVVSLGDVDRKRYVGIQATVTVVQESGLGVGADKGGLPSVEALLRAPHAIVVVTAQDGALRDTVFDGRLQVSGPSPASSSESVVDVQEVDIADSPFGPVFTASAKETGYVGTLVVGKGLALMLFQVSSHRGLMEALRVLSFRTSTFAVAGVHLTGRIPGAALDPVRAAALQTPLSINARVGEIARRVAGFAHPAMDPAQVASFGARLTALQTVANGFPITITAQEVDAYAAEASDLALRDAPFWERVARSRDALSREDILAELEAQTALADKAQSEVLRLHAKLVSTKGRVEASDTAIAGLRLALDNANAQAAAAQDAAAEREASLQSALDDAQAALDRLRARNQALEAENAALIADQVQARSELDAMHRKFVKMTAQLADAAYRAEKAELSARR